LLSFFMKVYIIPCHDRGHIYIVVVLQSCTDSLRVLPAASSETFPTPSDGTYDVGNIKVEEDVDVIEEIFTAINKEADIDIKQEEIPEDKTFPDIKSEQVEVSYMSVIRHILPLSRNVCFFCDVSISGQLKQFYCWEIIIFAIIMFFWGWCVGGRVCNRWGCLHGIAEKMKIDSYNQVGNNPYPWDVPKMLDQFQVLVQ